MLSRAEANLTITSISIVYLLSKGRKTKAPAQGFIYHFPASFK